MSNIFKGLTEAVDISAMQQEYRTRKADILKNADAYSKKYGIPADDKYFAEKVMQAQDDEALRTKQQASTDAAKQQQQASMQADKQNVEQLKAQLAQLQKGFDPNYQYSDDYSFVSKQQRIADQISQLKKRISNAEGMNETKEQDFGADWDAKIARLKQQAQQGERKTVWDPVKRVYKTVPINAPKKEEGVAEGAENYNGLQFSIVKDSPYLRVNAFAPGTGRALAQVDFKIDNKNELHPEDLHVEEHYRGQGIAATMYDYVKSKGYKIHRSWSQTDDGSAFWDKHRGEERVWEQGAAEADITRRGFLRGLGAAALGAAAGNVLAGSNDPGFIRKVQDKHLEMAEKNPRYEKEHAALQLPMARGITGNALEMNKRWAEKTAELLAKYGVTVNEGVTESVGQLSIQQLATISDEALDKAYGYGRSTPGNSFGWQANLMSAAYAKKMIDAGVTDIEKISDAIHKGWNVTAQKFVQNPNQFDDTEKLRQAGKLEAKLAQRAKLMKINYAQLDNDEQEKDRVVARALLQAIKGQQGVVENLEEAVGDNYLYHATQPAGMMRILRTGVIKASDRPQAATKAKTNYPTISTTRSKHYAESEDFVDFLNLTRAGNAVIIVFDRNAVANHYKMFSTSQGTQTVGDEYEEVIVVPKGTMPIQGTMKGFYFNPRRSAEIQEFENTPWFKELLNSPYYMGQKQGVAEAGNAPYWRVEQSEATGRYYVVSGYTNKSRRVWKSKQGAGDFNKKENAEAKAQELNQGVAEDMEDKKAEWYEHNGIRFKVEVDDRGLAIDAYNIDGDTEEGSEIGAADFFFTSTGELDPAALWVDDDYRNKGIAKSMYDFLKGKGYTVIRSEDQTPAGKAFWDKHRGEGVNVWEQDISEDINFEESFNMKINEINEDWQKVNKKDKTDGMSRKAVKAYRRENPGSKLKTAVTTKPSKLKKGSKAAKRRKSFCARMSGMKKSRASAKTKRDPNSPINKALRRWNCESIEQMQELIMIAESKIAEAKNAKQQAAIAIAKKAKMNEAHDSCHVCGQTPCNCTHSSSIMKGIKK